MSFYRISYLRQHTTCLEINEIGNLIPPDNDGWKIDHGNKKDPPFCESMNCAKGFVKEKCPNKCNGK